MEVTYTSKNICLYSYNSRGFGDDKQDICKILTTKNGSYLPIVCNQENFLLRNNGYKVKQCLPGFHIYLKSAVMDSMHGRPRNGMFIAVPLEIKENVKDVSPNHWRIQAVVINTINSKILVINSYFPNDPKSNDFDTSDLLTTLEAINQILNTAQFDHLIWAGDLNADFDRHTKFTSLIEQYVDAKRLKRSWDKFHADYTHAVDSGGRTFTSVIDHFHWSSEIDNNMVDASALYLPQNMSDHCPVYRVLNIDGLNARTQVLAETQPKPCWRKASQEQQNSFRINFKSNLEELAAPDCCSCCDVHCENEIHNHACDDYLVSLLKCLLTAANECLPTSAGRSKNNNDKKPLIPEWKKDIQHLKIVVCFGMQYGSPLTNL